MDRWDYGPPRPRQMGEPFNFSVFVVSFIVCMALGTVVCWLCR